MVIDPDDFRFSHVFDGVRLSSETAAFQLCDIHDEMLKQMIESTDEEDLRDECDVCEFSCNSWTRDSPPLLARPMTGGTPPRR